MKYLAILIFAVSLLLPNQSAANVSEFFESCINQIDQSYLKTSLVITNPNTNTVWTAPGKATLEWTTKNIPTNKTIQFYLSKDDMVVQELGIFNNTSVIDEIELTRGLEAGSNYRVFGIELFPDDKYSIAKYTTALFTIKKAPRETTMATKEAPKEPSIRSSFDGRKINYVKELNVSGENITINIWDHGRKDGDVVSIYLNGQAVVSKYLLEYTKKGVDITLDPLKANDLFLYAHNLGKYPPNTVSIEITDGKVSENIILNSDLKSCEAVIINVKK